MHVISNIEYCTLYMSVSCGGISEVMIRSIAESNRQRI